MGVSVSYQVAVRHLKKRSDCSRFVVRCVGPLAHDSEAWNDLGIGLEEQRRPISCPVGEFIGSTKQLVRYAFDAVHRASARLVVDSVPERWTEIEAVVEICGLNEDVGVEQIRHHVTPRRSLNSLKVDSFLNPSIRKASR